MCDIKKSWSSSIGKEHDPEQMENCVFIMSETELAESWASIRRYNSPSTSPVYSPSRNCERTDFKDPSSPSTTYEASFFEGDTIHTNVLSRTDKKRNLQWSKLVEGAGMSKYVDEFEVFGKGTKLMKSINFPTVIIKLLTRNLDKSMIYYVIVEKDTAEYTRKIPAVMFSNPYVHKKTRFAELLPLTFSKSSKSVCLIPMLCRKRYRRLFRRGRSFRISWLMSGRVFNSNGEAPWNRYDLRNTDMRILLRQFIEQDIIKISPLMRKTIKSLKLETKRRTGLPRGKANEQMFRHSLGNINSKEKEPLETTNCKPSGYGRNEKLTRIGNSVGYSSAEILKPLSPVKDVNKDPRCLRMSNLEKDSNNNFDSLDKYWCISDIA